jgi:iron-sulfur cluster repair protein YtfE (RIC family)
MPLIRDYVAEHERAMNLGGDAVRAIERGDLDEARSLLDALLDELRSHWRGEERGIFEVMRTEPEYDEYIRPLEQEHRELDELLTTVDLADPGDQRRIRAAVDELHEHILKEEDGLFPASLTALSGADWDAAMAAWAEAHPGRQPLDA